MTLKPWQDVDRRGSHPFRGQTPCSDYGVASQSRTSLSIAPNETGNDRRAKGLEANQRTVGIDNDRYEKG